MRNTRLVFEAFCDLYTEGLTIPELQKRTELSEDEIKEVIIQNKSLFYKKRIDSYAFIYLNRQRSLKCAYTLYKYSNMNSINFGFSVDDERFIDELCCPLYSSRNVKNLTRILGWSEEKLDSIINKWEQKGIVSKIGDQVSFSYLGWPLWASWMVYKIWMK